MVIPCDRLCPSCETTIWISCHPCPCPLFSRHLAKPDFPPQDITPDLALQLLPTHWRVRVCCGCSDGLHTVGDMSNKRQHFLVAQDMGVIHHLVLQCCSSKQERQVGNTWLISMECWCVITVLLHY